jgi:hypothetical protein
MGATVLTHRMQQSPSGATPAGFDARSRSMEGGGHSHRAHRTTSRCAGAVMLNKGIDVIEREPHLVADANAPQLVRLDQPVDRIRGQSQVFRERLAVKELAVVRESPPALSLSSPGSPVGKFPRQPTHRVGSRRWTPK